MFLNKKKSNCTYCIYLTTQLGVPGLKDWFNFLGNSQFNLLIFIIIITYLLSHDTFHIEQI